MKKRRSNGGPKLVTGKGPSSLSPHLVNPPSGEVITAGGDPFVGSENKCGCPIETEVWPCDTYNYLLIGKIYFKHRQLQCSRCKRNLAAYLEPQVTFVRSGNDYET